MPDRLAAGRSRGRPGAVRPIFITLDPERDTAAHFAEYVPLFHSRLIGSRSARGESYEVYYAKYPRSAAPITLSITLRKGADALERRPELAAAMKFARKLGRGGKAGAARGYQREGGLWLKLLVSHQF